MKTLKLTALAFGMMTIAFVGCKKDATKFSTTETENQEVIIDALGTQVETENDQMEATYNASTDDITIENAGIAMDYLVEENDIDADETSADASIAERAKIRKHSFIACLRKLDLEDKQVRKIKAHLVEYRGCKESAIKRARAIYNDLYKKYKSLAEEQTRLVKAGKITKDEYEARIARIRAAFTKELRAMQLQEKLHIALRNCYTSLLRNIHATLTDAQWKAFVACYRK